MVMRQFEASAKNNMDLFRSIQKVTRMRHTTQATVKAAENRRAQRFRASDRSGHNIIH